MKIKQITSQHRRDFTAVMVCEGCGHEELNKYGYDDDNYHRHVIPNMPCAVCEKSSNQLGSDYRPLQPKYPEGMQV